LGSEFKPNWFLPVHLGGYGIDPKYSRGPFEVTLAQRKVAALFMQTDLSLFAGSGKVIRSAKLRGLFGKNVQVPKSWMVDDYFVCDHPLFGEFCREDSPYQDDDVKDSWTAYLAYVERYSSLCSESPALVQFNRWVQKSMDNTWNIKPVQYQTILDWFQVRTLRPKGFPCPRLEPLY